MRATIARPSQYAEKFPATRPEKIPSDAPPSLDEVTTSFTWRESTEVKTLTNSGISAPASVPQEMIDASFHHCVVSPPKIGNDEIRNDVGGNDRNNRGEPDQRSQRRFKIHLVGIAEAGFRNRAIDEICQRA